MRILWGEVGSILPRKRVAFDPKILEILHVMQRLKYRAVKSVAQLNFPIRAVVESKMDAVSSKVFGSDHM